MMTMKDSSHFRILAYWSILILYAGMIFVFSSMSLTVNLSHLPQMDKLIHALEFGLFSIFLYRAIQVSFLKTPVIYLVLITACASILYGAIDEYHQIFTPLRKADLFDLLADALGVLIAQGIVLGRAYLKNI